MVWSPCLIRYRDRSGAVSVLLGHPLLDDYLEFVSARCRTNTLLATAYDLKVFFSVVAKPPAEVTTSDVLAFISSQRMPRHGEGKVVRLADGEQGLSARTIKRRLSSVSGLFGYLVTRAVVGVAANPVPRGLTTRQPAGVRPRGAPLVRAPRTLPRVLSPAEVDALLANLRTHRDRAMVEAMLLGGLRRCEVLGLGLEDLKAAERRVFVVEGKGGHQRLIPVSARFFTTVAAYLQDERPAACDTDAVFVVLKGPNRGRPLSPAGLDEIIRGARRRANLAHLTCHQLRHTCLTRLREAGMALEAVQAQAGHRSIESTRIYLPLANDWLAGEYHRPSAAIDTAAALHAPVQP
jgi:integrase/recombinase XerD